MVNTMKNIFKIATLVVALARTSALATGVTVVGGEDMFPSKDIIDNAVKSKDHTTLVAAVKAAGLVDTLRGSGPFTVLLRLMKPSMHCLRVRSRTCSNPKPKRR